MEIQINDWLNASQDTGNPNVDGTDVNIVCSANTGNARSDYFEIMAGVLENGEPVDELRERVTVSQAKYVQKIIGGNINLLFVRESDDSSIDYIDGIVSVQAFVNSIDVTGYYSYNQFAGGYDLEILENIQDIIDYSNNTVDIQFIITINTDKLRTAGYEIVKVKTQDDTNIQLVVDSNTYRFIIPETVVSIYSPAQDKEVNVSDTYTGLNISSANTFALEASIYFYFS